MQKEKLTETQQELVEANLGLARMAAWKFRESCAKVGIDWDDAFSIACLGLIKAVRTYDPIRGKQSTYMMFGCESAILMELRKYRQRCRCEMTTVSIETPIHRESDGDVFTIADTKLAAEAVDASKIKAGSITTNLVSSDFGKTLDLSSNTSIRTSVTQSMDEALQELEIGGVNLIQNSASHMLAADGDDVYWIAADELTPGLTYTLSVKETILIAGSASGVTWKVIEQESGTVLITGTLDFTYGKQVKHFTLPETTGNWALFLYAGISGTTTGVTVQFRQIKLEEGSVATAWNSSPEDDAAALSHLTGEVAALDSGFDGRVTSLISAMGLSDQFASAEEFLAALAEIEMIRSELAQHDSDLTLTFNRLAQTESGITQIFSSFVFGDDDGTPYLDMSASTSSMKMRLTNAKLAFIQSGQEVAYFSDNKLYITRLEVIEQISIGTSANGYLDIVTTTSGVGFRWRSLTSQGDG